MGVHIIPFTFAEINGMLTSEGKCPGGQTVDILYHSVACHSSELNRVPAFVC